MRMVDDLVIGAGVSGLAYANAILSEADRCGAVRPSVLILERSGEAGGYCKTIRQDGFTWDYSGHFFHFREPELEAWLRARMPGETLLEVEKRTSIRIQGRDIDFPFQKNIHQLPKADFIRCLTELYFRERRFGREPPKSFRDLVFKHYGSGIAEAFLVPYNEKLYACDLAELDADAMGRFFPEADFDAVMQNMERPDNASYNSRFSYPKGGAMSYIKALLHDLPEDALALNTPVEAIDLRRRTVTAGGERIGFKRLISSMPFFKLLDLAELSYEPEAFRYNQVSVHNLGFDRPSESQAHWMYFPEPSFCFYRVGWYSNILGEPRMSLYVEMGRRAGERIDVKAEREAVLADLERASIVTDHELVSAHQVTMDPAYVHVTPLGLAEKARLMPVLNAAGVYSIGRYGGWTYCSIEDNMLEARALAARFAPLLDRQAPA